MTCDECLFLMEEDLDAELNGRRASLLASHLAACSNCTKEYRTLRREREVYARYSRDVAVTPALWTAVRTRLEGSLKLPRIKLWGRLRYWAARLAVIPRLTPVLAASIILIAIAITALVMKNANLRQNKAQVSVGPQEAKQDAGQPLQPPLPSPDNTLAKEAAELKAQPTQLQGLSIRKSKSEMEASSGSAMEKVSVAHRYKQAPTVQELVAQAEQKYLAAIAILSRDLKKPGTTLDPLLRMRFEETLATIDRTIADTRKAVGQRPTDPEAVRYMLTAYAKKVEVLQEMASY